MPFLVIIVGSCAVLWEVSCGFFMFFCFVVTILPLYLCDDHVFWRVGWKCWDLFFWIWFYSTWRPYFSECLENHLVFSASVLPRRLVDFTLLFWPMLPHALLSDYYFCCPLFSLCYWYYRVFSFMPTYIETLFVVVINWDGGGACISYWGSLMSFILHFDHSRLVIVLHYLSFETTFWIFHLIFMLFEYI